MKSRSLHEINLSRAAYRAERLREQRLVGGILALSALAVATVIAAAILILFSAWPEDAGRQTQAKDSVRYLEAWR